MNVERLYKQELQQINPSSVDRQTLLIQAKQGDTQAKQALILSLLPIIWGYAIRWQRPPFIPAIELVGVGNMVLVERFDAALSEANPLGYLLKFASGEMVNYRMRYQNAITTPASFDEPFEIVNLFDDTDTFDVALPEDEAEPLIDFTPLHRAMDALPTEYARQFMRQVFGLGTCPVDLSEIAGGNSTTKQYQAAKTLKFYHLKKLRTFLIEHYPDFAQTHIRNVQVDKAATYASVKIPEVTRRKLEMAKAQLQASGQVLSMNKLRKLSGVNTRYASAYLHQCTAIIDY